MNSICQVTTLARRSGLDRLKTTVRILGSKDATLHVRCQSTFMLDSPISMEALDKARPFEEIPGPRPLPLVGNLFRYLPVVGQFSKKYWHESQAAKFKLYGPIVREQIVPGFNMVHLYDPKDMEAVSRHEGKHPNRDFFVGMARLRKQRPDIYSSVGVAAGNGEDWYHIRSRSQKVMMKPQVMRQYLPQMNIIADDMIRRMRKLRNQDHEVPGLMNELFKWALESVTYILFVQRMGCLSDDLRVGSIGQKYIEAVNQFFRSTASVELSTIPIWRLFPSLSPAFRKLRSVHDFFFQSAMEYTKEALTRVDQNRNKDHIESSLMEELLRHCSPEDACVMAVDAMAAGIDTTSLSLAYVLRNLAANPEAQKKLQEEIDRVLPNKQNLTAEKMEQLPYMRACIKESMRISPTVQGTSRTLDKDIVLSGYRVPAKTLLTLNYYVSSNQESNFLDAEKYIPERWMRDCPNKHSTKDSFAYQPFGFGPRMCIGRRIADLEMNTLLAKIMQNFWVENKHKEMDINFQLVLMIKSPLRYEFYDRK